MAIDPVCEMEVDDETVEFKSQYASQTYYFAQQNAKNYLNKGQNNMRGPHKHKKWCTQLE